MKLLCTGILHFGAVAIVLESWTTAEGYLNSHAQHQSQALLVQLLMLSFKVGLYHIRKESYESL